jgi:predicted small lipoprotein YifL
MIRTDLERRTARRRLVALLALALPLALGACGKKGSLRLPEAPPPSAPAPAPDAEDEAK